MESMVIDNVIEMMKCPMCSQTFVEPVQLPCGETVCKSHFINLVNESKFKCEFCANEHDIPMYGFPKSRIIQQMLQINFNNIQDTECNFYKNAKESFNEFHSRLKLFESIYNNPNNLIEGYFGDLIQRIESIRSNLHLEIDAHFNKVIEEVNMNMNECIFGIAKNKEFVVDELEYFKNELGKNFKLIDLNDTKWLDIETKTKIQIRKIKFIMKETIERFLLNNSYDFISPVIDLNNLNVKPLENFIDYREQIRIINQSLKRKLDEGNWHKYKLINYDDIKYDINEQHMNELDADHLIKCILMDKNQIEHLNFIKSLESNSKQIKNYVILRKEDSNLEDHVLMCIVYADVNESYKHEFLNRLGFAVLIKNPKFEKI